MCGGLPAARHRVPLYSGQQGPVQVKDARVAAVAAQGVQGTGTGGDATLKHTDQGQGAEAGVGPPLKRPAPASPSLVLSGKRMWSRPDLPQLLSPHNGGQILVRPLKL